MRALLLLFVGVCLTSIVSASPYTVSLLTGGPQILDLASGKYAGKAWLYASGIDDAGVGIGYYFSTNGNPPTTSVFREQNLGFFGSPTNPTVGPQEVATAISSNGLYSAGLYEPLSPGKSNFVYIQQGASPAQALTLPADTFGYSIGATSSIVGINNNGTLVANVTPALSGPYTAEVITNGLATILNFPGAVSTTLGGINNNGVIVGNAAVGTASSISAFVTFTYHNGVFTTVYSTPFSSAQFLATGINDNGQIVGVIDPNDIFNEYAALLDGGVIVNLNSSYTNNPYPYYPFQFAYAAGINNLGDIIGSDRNGSILVATPASLSQIPEVGTFGFFGVSMLLAPALRSRFYRRALLKGN